MPAAHAVLGPRLHIRLFWLREHLRGRAADVQLVRRLVAPGEVTIDIGAHRGFYTGVLARAVGDRGCVHAFEPNPSHWDRLAEVARAYGNVTVHRIALSDVAATGALRIPVVGGREIDALASLSRSFAEGHEHPGSVSVELQRLDDIIPASRSISFLKCDVEGHETSVLSGAVKTIARDHPAMLVEIEERHRPGTLIETLQLLESLQYAPFFFKGAELRPIESFDLERDQLRFVGRELDEIMPREYVYNFLFVRRDRHLRQVLQWLA